MADDKIDFSEVDLNIQKFNEDSKKPTSANEALVPNVSGILSENDVNEVVREVNLEKKFGDSPVRTFAESAASAISLGLSDQALVKSGIVSPEALRERRERNETAAVTGEVAGIVGGVLASGGTSAAARAASIGVKAASKAGLAAEKFIAKSLGNVVSQSGNKALARQVVEKMIVKGAGSAVEGALYGAGKLNSDLALGTAEFNSSNVAAHLGTGALLGGALGASIGALSKVSVPVFKGNKVTDFVSKKVKEAVDPVDAAQSLQRMTPAQKMKQLELRPDIAENAPKYLDKLMSEGGFKTIASDTQLLKASQKKLDSMEESVQRIFGEADDLFAKTSSTIQPTRVSLNTSIIKDLNQFSLKNFYDPKGKALPGASKNINVLNKLKDELLDQISNRDVTRREVFSLSEMNELRRKYDKLARKSTGVESDLNHAIADSLRNNLKQTIGNVDGALGMKVRKEFLDYTTAIEVTNNLKKSLNAEAKGSLFSTKDMFIAGSAAIVDAAGLGVGTVAFKRFMESSAKNKLTILMGVEKANQSIGSRISKSVSAFSAKSSSIGAKAALATKPVTTKLLLSSPLAKDMKEIKDRKDPKNIIQALQNISTNLQSLKSVDKVERVIKSMGLLDVAQSTAIDLASILHTSVAFLDSKLPKPHNVSTGISHMLNRPWKPSSQEVYKFERYLEAVQNPMSVLNDLESGKVNRESIEAVQTVYPDLYARIQTEIMQSIAQNPGQMTYQKRLQLGIVLNIPTDISLDPNNILALQNHYLEAAESQTGGFGSSEVPNLAEGSKSTVEKTLTRT
jgi:hypothetical protein